MKLSTSHWLLGIGAVLTAVATGIATKLASDKVNEIRQVRQAQDPEFQDLTFKEKFKIYAVHEAIPLTMGIGVCTGIYQSYKTSQEAIKTSANIATGAGAVINGYRDLTREAIGKKKEDELYTKVIEKEVMSKNINTPIIPSKDDDICMFISPVLNEAGIGIPFASNVTKIKATFIQINDYFIKKIRGTIDNNAVISISEILAFFGIEANNKLLDTMGFDWQKDGPLDVEFQPGFTDTVRPAIGVVFMTNPHQIY